MQKYELVLLLNARKSEEELSKVIASVEKALPKDSILNKDDAWVMQSEYLFWRDKELDKMYLISYHLQLNSEDMISFKKEVAYYEEIIRFFFYKMSNIEEFITYKDANSWSDKLISKYVGNTTLSKKVNILCNKDNVKYLLRKNVTLLNKYITRFDEIKPRKFTWHSVKVQKKLRKVIIRARELWLIRYKKN